MYELLRRWTLAVLKTPAEPHPPIGDPASLRVFHAGRNYFRLRIARWTVAEFVALGGIIFWTAFLIEVEGAARAQKEARASQAETTSTPVASSENDAPTKSKISATRHRENWKDRLKASAKKAAVDKEYQGEPVKKGTHVGWAGFKQAGVELALLLPAGAFVVIWTIKIFSMLLFLVQIPVTYAIRRLDYEMRWYMVTDRSLRLRHGVWRISESTMSFANIQQVVVSQGPLQRLLGLGDVKVKSAGGGGGEGHYDHHEGDDMHTGLFHSVTNATEIRDLIVERLRRFREAGLGDPDEKSAADALVTTGPTEHSNDTLKAARDLVAEARALRVAVSAR